VTTKPRTWRRRRSALGDPGTGSGQSWPAPGGRPPAGARGAAPRSVSHPGKRRVPEPVPNEAGDASVRHELVPARGVTERGSGDRPIARSRDQGESSGRTGRVLLSRLPLCVLASTSGRTPAAVRPRRDNPRGRRLVDIRRHRLVATRRHSVSHRPIRRPDHFVYLRLRPIRHPLPLPGRCAVWTLVNRLRLVPTVGTTVPNDFRVAFRERPFPIRETAFHALSGLQRDAAPSRAAHLSEPEPATRCRRDWLNRPEGVAPPRSAAGCRKQPRLCALQS
jgi:hypothetical protein